MREGTFGENRELEMGMGEGMDGCRTSLKLPGQERGAGSGRSLNFPSEFPHP